MCEPLWTQLAEGVVGGTVSTNLLLIVSIPEEWALESISSDEDGPPVGDSSPCKIQWEKFSRSSQLTLAA